MSLEQALKENTEAVLALTAALAANGGKPASGGSEDKSGKTESTRGRGTSKSTKEDKGSDDKPKFTADDVKAAAVKIKEEKGTPAAKKLIAQYGEDGLASIEPKDYAAFIEAAEKLLKGEDDKGGEDDL